MGNDANKLKQRQEIRKYLVFAGMFLLFIGCLLILSSFLIAPIPFKKTAQE